MSIYSFFSSLFRSFSSFFKRALTPKKRRDRYAKSLGFTLLEVLVVMIIVGILSAIAAPSWLSFVNNQRINASQTKVFQAIKTAQSDAKIRQNNDSQTTGAASSRTKITFTTNSNSPAYRLDNFRSNGGDQSLDTGIIIKNVTTGGSTSPTVVAPSVLTSPYTLEFDSKGFLYDPNSTLVYPICINLSVFDNTSKKIKWIKIQTLLGAITTDGSDNGTTNICSG